MFEFLVSLILLPFKLAWFLILLPFKLLFALSIGVLAVIGTFFIIGGVIMVLLLFQIIPGALLRLFGLALLAAACRRRR